MAGAEIAIFNEGRILLTLREDFEVWCLPGGGLDSGESFAQAALREAREETGLDVKLTRFVGSYTRPNWSNGLYHIHLFAAEVTGGTITTQADEVLDIRYFPLDDLPEAMLLGHCHRILDAASGLTGIVKTEMVDWPFPGLDRWGLYQLRDESGFSRLAFYQRHFPPLKPAQTRVDFPGVRVRTFNVSDA